MLSKYDDEEDEAGMEISAQGVVLDAKAREQADIRRKLAEGMLCPLSNPCTGTCGVAVTNSLVSTSTTSSHWSDGVLPPSLVFC